MAGSIKTNSVQLGDSATDSQNFLLKTNVDGTAKLARGAAGNLGDILTVDASGVVALPANTTTKLVSASGTAPVYGCRAFCSFNGTTVGTFTPPVAGNVTSVTRNSVGNYTITFATALPSTTYTVSANVASSLVCGPAASTVSVCTLLVYTSAGVATDSGLVNLQVFG